MTSPAWLDTQLFGNAISHWLIAIGSALLAAMIVSLLRGTVVRRLEVVAAKTETAADDFVVALLRAIRPWLVIAVTLAIAEDFLDLPVRVDKVAHWVIVGAMVLQALRWINASVDFWVDEFARREGGSAQKSALSVFAMGARLILWTLVILVAVHSITNAPLTTIVASLGVGGVAIALAVQNILGDLFGALAIALDKPFLVGDSVAVDTFEGTIEHIGLKTTRIRSVNGEQVVFSNADLLRSRIRNLTRREGRRMVFTLSIAPGTPVAQLAKVPELIAKVIEREPRATLQRTHVTGTGPLGFEVETSFLVPHPEYNHAFDVRQAILFATYDALERERIELAKPVASVPALGVAPSSSAHA